MMEKVNDMELYMALDTVKQYCQQQENCDTCAMWDGISCPLNTEGIYPQDWKLREPLKRWEVFDN